jgi:hypothetical protein
MFKVAVVVFLSVAIAAVIHPPNKAVHPTSIETRLGVVHAPQAFELSFRSPIARPSALGAAVPITADERVSGYSSRRTTRPGAHEGFAGRCRAVSRCSLIAMAAAGLPSPERFSRCRPQPGYRSGYDQG